jgi:signal transduction histidine kinase
VPRQEALLAVCSGKVRLPRLLDAAVGSGVTADLEAPLRKRVRLANGLALFAALIMFASVPFDEVTAPRWMIGEDLLGGPAFLLVPLLNRLGLYRASRLACLALANAIVLLNAALLGRDSGAAMVFIAIAAVPFAFFDLDDRIPLVAGVVLAVACFLVVESGALARFQAPSPGYSASAYHLYSGAVTLTALLFILIQTARANDRAERELRENRQAAIYSAKMAALGEMSGNIAHEVNNPLAAILLRAQRLIRLGEGDRLDGAQVRETGRSIEQTASRIARIVDALRSFARDVEKDPMRSESVQRIVTDTVELCAQRLRQHTIVLEIDPIAADLYVECRSVQISQILLNLVSNAHDAVTGQPTRWVRISAEASAPEEVSIKVTDSGPGVPPELRPRIMEPFFTTKGFGKGTGLGLSVSKGIAEAHGGRLAYDAAAAHTCFVLTLPRRAI